MENILDINSIVNDFVEVTFDNPNDFLKIKETLTRIGIGSNNKKVLYQSCHILQKQGKYYIVHFKELFKLDGKPTQFTEQDLARRNSIVALLSDWGLVKVVDPDKIKEPRIDAKLIKILPYAEKKNWQLESKYTIGQQK